MALNKYFALSIIAASVAMSACSSNDDDNNDNMNTTAGDTGTTDTGITTTGDTTTGTTTTGATTGGTTVVDNSTMTGNSILDLLRGTDGSDGTDATDGVEELSSLAGALADYPSLLNALDDENTVYTVFAPNNDAFDNADLTGVDVENTLSYHVAQADANGMAFNPLALDAGATFPMTLTTVQGGTLTIEESTDGTGGYTVTDSAGNTVALPATPTTTDNGSTVYVIDQILVAPAAMGGTTGGDSGTTTTGDTTAGGTTTGSTTGGMATAGTALAVIQSESDLSEFASIVGSTSLGDSLGDVAGDGGSDNWVTLAPTNTALAGMTPEDARAFVLKHVTVVSNPGGTLSPGQTARTNGDDAVSLTIGGTADALTVNGFPATLITSGATPGGQVYRLEGTL